MARTSLKALEIPEGVTLENNHGVITFTGKLGNLSLEIGYLDDNKNNDGLFGSAKVVVPLGENKIKTDETNFTQLKSVRHKLYMPVKRENKIKVVKISKSGVKISGF